MSECFDSNIASEDDKDSINVINISGEMSTIKDSDSISNEDLDATTLDDVYRKEELMKAVDGSDAVIHVENLDSLMSESLTLKVCFLFVASLFEQSHCTTD